MTKRPRRRYTAEFKAAAVARLDEAGGDTCPGGRPAAADCRRVVTAGIVTPWLSFRHSIVVVTETLSVCRDPKDDKFLALAVASRADYLVTGDADLLSLGSFRGIPIIRISDVLALVQ